MKRIVLFVATNVAVLAVIYLVLNILGIENIMTADGTRLDLGALLTFSAVVGFTGALEVDGQDVDARACDRHSA
jgi:heat shock protein HtpX